MRQATRFLSALALPLLTTGSQRPLTLTTHQTIPTSLFTELDTLARLVDITYCITPAGGVSSPFACLSRCASFPSYDLVTTWHTGLLISDSAGYIALDHSPSDPKIVVAFRGTASLPNVVVDLATVPQEYVPYAPGNGTGCEGCSVHMGFLQAWRDSRGLVMPHVLSIAAVYPGYRLMLVGHSLGGAVAALAGLDLLGRGYEPVVTTFGEPRIGNGKFAEWVDEAFGLSGGSGNVSDWKFRRVTHMGDPVPLLPLADWGYTSHGGEIYINKEGVPPDVEDLRICKGAEDPQCISGPEDTSRWWTSLSWEKLGYYKPWQSLFGHRRYFVRMGLCVPDLWHD